MNTYSHSQFGDTYRTPAHLAALTRKAEQKTVSQPVQRGISFYIASGRRPGAYRKAFWTVTFGKETVEFGHCTWLQLQERARNWAARNGFAGRVEVTVYA